MGLSAVMFGAACHDWELPPVAAAALSLSRRRGWRRAERAADRAAATPAAHRDAGHAVAVPRHRRRHDPRGGELQRISARVPGARPGLLWGVIPAQLPILVVAFAAYVVLLHRSVSAARCTPSASARRARGTRYSRGRRVGLVYLLSGVVASARRDRLRRPPRAGRSDAGTGYELDAITAVVLGGTSVFGGRGTLWGTLLGLFVARRAEERAAAGGAADRADRCADRRRCSIATIAHRSGFGAPAPRASPVAHGEEFIVKNSQVAVLCAAILAGALIVAGTNVWLVRSLAGCTPAAPADRARRRPRGRSSR